MVTAKKMAKKEDGWASVLACCGKPPAFETSKHDLDPVLAFVFSLVISDGFAAGFPGRNAELYSFLFQCIPKSVGIIPAIGQHSLRDGKAIKKR